MIMCDRCGAKYAKHVSLPQRIGAAGSEDLELGSEAVPKDLCASCIQDFATMVKKWMNRPQDRPACGS
jgi:hypothetical protein